MTCTSFLHKLGTQLWELSWFLVQLLRANCGAASGGFDILHHVAGQSKNPWATWLNLPLILTRFAGLPWSGWVLQEQRDKKWWSKSLQMLILGKKQLHRSHDLPESTWLLVYLIFFLFRQEPAIQLQHFWGTWRKLRTKSRGSLKDWGKLREVQRSHVSIIGFHFLTWTTAYQYLRTGWSARNSETGVSTWSIFTGFDQPLLSRRPSDGQRSKHHGLFLAHCHSPPASRRGKIMRRRLSHI